MHSGFVNDVIFTRNSEHFTRQSFCIAYAHIMTCTILKQISNTIDSFSIICLEKVNHKYYENLFYFTIKDNRRILMQHKSPHELLLSKIYETCSKLYDPIGSMDSLTQNEQKR